MNNEYYVWVALLPGSPLPIRSDAILVDGEFRMWQPVVDIKNDSARFLHPITGELIKVKDINPSQHRIRVDCVTSRMVTEHNFEMVKQAPDEEVSTWEDLIGDGDDDE
jgi:hypothetical protein